MVEYANLDRGNTIFEKNERRCNLKHSWSSQQIKKMDVTQPKGGKHHSQVDYIFVRKRFRSGDNTYSTRGFPEADIEVTMTWR